MIVQHAKNIWLAVMVFLNLLRACIDPQRMESIGSYEKLNGASVFDLRCRYIFSSHV